MTTSTALTLQAALHQAVNALETGRYAEVEVQTSLLVGQHPDLGLAWKLLGVSLQAQGKNALPVLQMAAKLLPDDAAAHSNLGNALRESGQLDEAAASCRRALSIHPDYTQALNNLGASLVDLGLFDDAETLCRRALLLDSSYAEAHNNLGNALTKLGQFEGAEPCYLVALILNPDYTEAHNNLGNALKCLGRFEQSTASYGKALALNSDYAEAHNNLGNVQQVLGQLDNALASCRRALELKPDFAEANNNLGYAFEILGQLDRALANYHRALRIKPDFAAVRNGLLFMHNYLSDQPAETMLAEAKNFGDLVARQAHPYTTWENDRKTDRCLKVGIVSADLWNHPVGYFAENVLAALAAHAAGRVEVTAYVSHTRFDEVTKRIQASCHDWQSTVGITDERLAQKIRDDGIDILIDLSGHTAHNRLPLFAWKPAPVQATWLGYFATTGVPAIDYLIADPWTLPETIESQFTETIWRLPETRLCFTPPDADIDVAPLPARQNGYITFGCFNNLTKLNDGVLALWARVLQAVPGSRLFLKSKQLGVTTVRQGMTEKFGNYGITPERLILEGPSPRGDYLSAYHRVDIGLDPFPYPGGTVTAESLWMGVPVLTLTGDRFLSRQGVGLLMNAGLPDWVAEDQDDYVARAAAHARDLEHLAQLRTGLRPQVLASPLFDAPRFARHFEQALRGMWARWCGQQMFTDLEREHEQKEGSAGRFDKRLEEHVAALITGGAITEAMNLAQMMTQHFPLNSFGWKVFGGLLGQMGRCNNALAPMLIAVELSPEDTDAHNNLGNILKDLKRSDAAEVSYRRALKLEPDYAEAHNNLGTVLQNLGRQNQAEASYRQAIQIKSDYAEAHNNLGNSLRDQGKLNEAEAAYRQALQINSNYVEAYSNLGNILFELDRSEEAEVSYRQALKIDPDYAEAHRNLGYALQANGQLDSAMACYRQALEIRPDFLAAHSNLLFIHNLLSDQPAETMLRDAQRFGGLMARQAHPYTLWSNTRETERCLRVGLVSGDLWNHPVGYFAENVLAALAAHAQGRVEVTAYVSHTRFDEVTKRIQASCHDWQSTVGITDERLAQKIREDGIDILIDLSGHTAHNRLPLFAWKPAPVQATWLGYFATTGVAAIDYLIADPWTLPETLETQFTETIWRLPETRLCFTPPDADIDVAPLPARQNGYITFGCFNNLTKLNDGVLALWARVLQAVPGSRLFLKSKQLGVTTVRQGMTEKFGNYGITPDRLILEGPSPRGDYLSAYHRVDIGLDPFPYPGGTVTAESLWMGVPVLTLTGDRFLSRQGVGLMMNAGLPDWVAEDQDNYVARAAAHAKDLERLAQLRTGLRPQVLASPLFDAPRFARHFEQALRGMWARWCGQFH